MASSLENALQALQIMQVQLVHCFGLPPLRPNPLLHLHQNQNSAPDTIKEATTWLENFQNTQEAWSVCDTVRLPLELLDAASSHFFLGSYCTSKIMTPRQSSLRPVCTVRWRR